MSKVSEGSQIPLMVNVGFSKLKKEQMQNYRSCQYFVVKILIPLKSVQILPLNFITPGFHCLHTTRIFIKEYNTKVEVWNSCTEYHFIWCSTYIANTASWTLLGLSEWRIHVCLGSFMLVLDALPWVFNAANADTSVKYLFLFSFFHVFQSFSVMFYAVFPWRLYILLIIHILSHSCIPISHWCTYMSDVTFWMHIDLFEMACSFHCFETVFFSPFLFKYRSTSWFWYQKHHHL